MDDLSNDQVNLLSTIKDPVKREEAKQQIIADNKWLLQVKANLSENDQEALKTKGKDEVRLFLMRSEGKARNMAESILSPLQKEAFETMSEQEKKVFLREVYKTHQRAKDLAQEYLTPEERQMLKNLSPEEKKSFLEQKVKDFEREAMKGLTAEELRQFTSADPITKQKMLMKSFEKKGIAAPTGF